MTAASGQAIGRTIKYADFVRCFDLNIRASGNDPTSIDGAALDLARLEQATPEDWARITADVNALAGKKYEVPSAEGVAVLKEVYRARARLPAVDQDAADLALQVERRVRKLESGEEEAREHAATAARYVAWFDKRRIEQGRDPHNPGGCIALAYEMGRWTRGRWWHRSKDVGEKFAPAPEVVRLIIDTYRARGGLGPVAAVAPAASASSHQDDVALLADAMSPASRAEQLDVQDQIDREEERKQRFGGSR